MSRTSRHSFRESAFRRGDRCDPALEPPRARGDLETVLPELGAIGLEDEADDPGQTEAYLLAECLAVGLAEQCVPGYCEESVVRCPDLEVCAVLVKLEHKIIERREQSVQTSFALAQSLRRSPAPGSIAHNASPGLKCAAVHPS